MGFFKFLKLPKHKNFNFQPRYWDQEKEEREKKLKRYTKDEETSPEAIKERISSSFRQRGTPTHLATRQKQVRNSNIRLVIIIVLLCVAAYVLINVYLPSMLDALGIGEG